MQIGIKISVNKLCRYYKKPELAGQIEISWQAKTLVDRSIPFHHSIRIR